MARLKNIIDWAQKHIAPKAQAVIKDPKKLKELAQELESKMTKNALKNQLNDVWDDLKCIVSLVKDTALGRYVPQSYSSLALIVMAIIYLINPMDLVPDLLVGGLFDDVALIGWVLTQTKSEIERYRKFQSV